MTAPSYTTDLNDIVLMETGDTFEEFTGYAFGDNAALEPDWFLQGAQCASDEANNKTGVGHSIGYDYGSNITFATDECFFGWMQCQAGNAMDTYANGGYRVLIGASISDYNGWYVGGRDFGRNPYGGWVNVAVDPTFTPVDDTNGTPGAYRHFAVAFNMTSGISKGRPLNADAYRYGRGDLIVEYGEAADYAIFSGMAAANDATAARWGLFQQEGTGYLWKGLLSFGTSTNAVDFRDSNANITIDDTPKTYAAFNKIEIVNASSNVEWTGVNITALNPSGLSIGAFEMIDDATVEFTTCTFTDMNTFIFDSNATITTTTFRRCGLVTQAGGTFDGCNFDSASGTYAFLVDDLDIVDNCDFISDGTGYALDLAAGMAGNSYTMIGCTFTGYAGTDGSTGNECIRNNTGGHVTISVGAGQIPTVHNVGASTTTITASVPLYIIVRDEANVPIQNAQVGVFKLTPTEELIDEYPSSNFSSAELMSGNDAYKACAQTFVPGVQGVLSKASFYISRTGTLTGNVYARLYATSAGAPTGTHIAESAAIAASTLSTSIALVDFTFTDEITMEEGVTYAIAVEYPTNDGAGNRINVGNDNTSPAHSGTAYRLSVALDTWSSSGTYDFIFYVYADVKEIVNQDTDVNGEVDTSYTQTTPVNVKVWIRKASSGATKYKNFSTLQTIATTTGLSLAVTMIVDPINNATS